VETELALIVSNSIHKTLSGPELGSRRPCNPVSPDNGTQGIPALEKSAESLNHAFTLISEVFETKRRSHSGNVFERV
jgi:hypothetical protein